MGPGKGVADGDEEEGIFSRQCEAATRNLYWWVRDLCVSCLPLDMVLEGLLQAGLMPTKVVTPSVNIYLPPMWQLPFRDGSSGKCSQSPGFGQ